MISLTTGSAEPIIKSRPVFRRILLAVLIAFLFTGAVRARPAEIKLTASGGTAVAYYLTLKQAFDAINNGTHTGIIKIAITYDITETSSAVLNASGTGEASYSAITISPSGQSPRYITGAIAAGSPLIDLNGASNVTIDGLNSDDNSLIISNTTSSSVTNTSTIRFINGASNNVITNCKILGSSLTTFSNSNATILFATDNTALTGNDNNIISNNLIGPAGSNYPAYGIGGAGTTTTLANYNSSNSILNNQIFDFFSMPASASYTAGVYLASGNTGYTISNNSFYKTLTATTSKNFTLYGICIADNTADSFTITGNYIGGRASKAGGAPFTIGTTGSPSIGFNGIIISTNLSASNYNSVQGNVIKNIDWTSYNAVPWIGIGSSGNSRIGTITGNIIGNSTDAGNIKITNAAGGAAVSRGISASRGTAYISNNTIGSIDIGATSTGATHDFTGIYATAIDTIISNIIGSATAVNSINCSNQSVSEGSQSLAGIYLAGSGSKFVQNNLISNLNNNDVSSAAGQTAGIATDIYARPINITSNIVRKLSTSASQGNDAIGASLIGIGQAAQNVVISQNLVDSLVNTATTGAPKVVGILSLTPGSLTILAERNLVRNLFLNTSDQSASLTGMFLGAGYQTIQNNIITLGTGVNTGYCIRGIVDSETVYSNKFYFNTVYIGGTPAGGSDTYAFLNNATGNSRDYRNNLLVNARSNTSGSAKHYAISLVSNTSLVNDYNDYYAPGAGGVIGYLFADQPSLIDFAEATGKDSHSLNLDPQFVNAGDTSAASYKAAAHLNGTTITGITTDYFSVARPATPSIGAMERASILPLYINNFNGIQNAHTIRLSWQGYAEPGLENYVIEKNVNGTFIQIGTVAVINGDIASYTFDDLQPSSGSNLYRLSKTDKDGSKSYSKIINVSLVNNFTGHSIRIYPNVIVDHKIILNYSGVAHGDYVVSLFNTTGQLMYHTITHHGEETSGKPMNLPLKIVKGVYHVKITGTNVMYNESIMVN